MAGHQHFVQADPARPDYLLKRVNFHTAAKPEVDGEVIDSS